MSAKSAKRHGQAAKQRAQKKPEFVAWKRHGVALPDDRVQRTEYTVHPTPPFAQAFGRQCPTPNPEPSRNESRRRSGGSWKPAAALTESRSVLLGDDYCSGISIPSFASSSSWMMIRGVTIIIRLCASRPMPTFLNSRLTHGTLL